MKNETWDIKSNDDTLHGLARELEKNDELLVNRCEQLTKRGSFNCTSVNFETVGMIEDVHMMAARVID